MPTLNFIDQPKTLPDFIRAHCPDVKETQLDTACRILANYNLRRPHQPIFHSELIAVVPDDLENTVDITSLTVTISEAMCYESFE